MIEMQCLIIAGEPPTQTSLKQWHCVPHLRIRHLKRRRFIVSYIHLATV